jgi:hypothetical protein
VTAPQISTWHFAALRAAISGHGASEKILSKLN